VKCECVSRVAVLIARETRGLFFFANYSTFFSTDYHGTLHRRLSQNKKNQAQRSFSTATLLWNCVKSTRGSVHSARRDGGDVISTNLRRGRISPAR